jgi:hypothetical protein
MIGVPEGPPRFSAWLHQRTGGNPLFVVETLKMLLERGTLEVADGNWRTDLDGLTNDYSEITVPPGVVQVIRQRVDDVSEPAQRVLEMSSVLGEVWDAARLAPLVDMKPWGVLLALEELEAHGLLEGGGFSHDLVRTAVYDRLGPQRSRTSTVWPRRLVRARSIPGSSPNTGSGRSGPSGPRRSSRWPASGRPTADGGRLRSRQRTGPSRSHRTPRRDISSRRSC